MQPSEGEMVLGSPATDNTFVCGREGDSSACVFSPVVHSLGTVQELK